MSVSWRALGDDIDRWQGYLCCLTGAIGWPLAVWEQLGLWSVEALGEGVVGFVVVLVFVGGVVVSVLFVSRLNCLGFLVCLSLYEVVWLL